MMNFSAISGLTFLLSLQAFGMGGGRPSDLPMFNEVVKGSIYRGGVPTEKGLKTLDQMHIKTVLNIRDEDPLAEHEEKELVRELGMAFISIPISAIFPPADEDINAIENALADSKNYPIFIHCTHGQDRTGLAIGLYRVIHQHVPPKEAYQEMLRLGFHEIFIALKHYFTRRTGYTPEENNSLALRLYLNNPLD